MHFTCLVCQLKDMLQLSCDTRHDTRGKRYHLLFFFSFQKGNIQAEIKGNWLLYCCIVALFLTLPVIRWKCYSSETVFIFHSWGISLSAGIIHRLHQKIKTRLQQTIRNLDTAMVINAGTCVCKRHVLSMNKTRIRFRTGILMCVFTYSEETLDTPWGNHTVKL